MSIANSNFEEWTIQRKSFNIMEFPFSIKKVSLDGALFDQTKLDYFSRDIIARKPIDEEMKEVKGYAEEYDEKLRKVITDDEEKIKKILSIGKNMKNPRKDYANYAEIYPLIRYFFKEEYEDIRSE